MSQLTDLFQKENTSTDLRQQFFWSSSRRAPTRASASPRWPGCRGRADPGILRPRTRPGRARWGEDNALCRTRCQSPVGEKLGRRIGKTIDSNYWPECTWSRWLPGHHCLKILVPRNKSECKISYVRKVLKVGLRVVLKAHSRHKA